MRWSEPGLAFGLCLGVLGLLMSVLRSLSSLKPPPLPPRRLTIPTWVYCVLFCILFLVNAAWAYQRVVARFPGDRNPAFAIGVVQGGLLFPLAAAAGIACIWKQNRGFRGVVRVLFWASLFLLFTKLSQLASSTRSWHKSGRANRRPACQLNCGR